MAKTPLLWVARHLVNRDGGLYDRLPWDWGGEGKKSRSLSARLILMDESCGLCMTQGRREARLIRLGGRTWAQARRAASFEACALAG
jgi:hypothetical protein